MTSTNGLKKLGFVPEVAEKTAHTAQTAYAKAKDVMVPESVKPRLENLEQSVTSAAAPYVHKAQDAGATILHQLDERVDAAAAAASRAYASNSAYLQQQLQKQKEFHAQNLEAYKTAREAYLKKVEDAVEFVRQNGLTGSARKAADEVLARVSEAKGAMLAAPGMLLHKVQQAVDQLLTFAPVNSVVEAAKPSLGAAKEQYLRVHDNLVASQQYKQVYALAGDVVQRAQQTWLYEKAKQSLLPLAKPAVDTVVASPYFNSLVQHLQPIEAPRA